jgi:hypothetical protein
MIASVVPPRAMSAGAIFLRERNSSLAGCRSRRRSPACFVAHGCRDTCGEGLVNEKKLFEIGSIAKLFTALLLSDMANRGEEPYSVGNLIIVDGFAA